MNNFMTLEKLLSIDNVYKLSQNDLINYFNEVGYKNLKSEHVEEIIKHFGSDIFGFTGFSEIYFAVTSRESDKVMNRWTRCIGWFTVAIGIMTFIMLMIAIFKKS